MSTEYKKYKVYLICLGVFTIISFVFGYLMYQSKISEKKWFDEIYEVIVNGEDKAKDDIIDKFNNSIKENDKKYTKESILEKLNETKKGEIYVLLEEGKDAEVISTLSIQYLSMFNGFMMIVSLLLFIEKKFLKGLNNILRIILNIVAVIVIMPYAYYIIIIGSIGLPIALFYYLYKYFKTRKNTSKTNSDECVEVLGKVDANEIFSDKDGKKEITKNDKKDD